MKYPLEIEFVTTERCNFGCDYCYMKNNASSFTFDKFLKFYKYIDFLLRVYGAEKYRFVFFGGEPTLEWELVKDIVYFIGNDNKKDSITLVTNGSLLTKEKLEFIKERKINLSISYDGFWNDKPINEEQIKLWLNYTKSFKTMIAPNNLNDLIDNFNYFVSYLGVSYPDFTIVRDNVWSDDDVELFKLKIHELKKSVVNYYNIGVSALPTIFSMYLQEIVNAKNFGKREYGCFAGCTGIGVMADGKVYPCARFGSLDKDSWLFDYEDPKANKDNFRFFNNPKICKPENFLKCKDCDINKYCNAGCTYSQLKNNNNESNEPLDCICKLYKIIYNEALDLCLELKDNMLFKKNLIERRVV